MAAIVVDEGCDEGTFVKDSVYLFYGESHPSNVDPSKLTVLQHVFQVMIWFAQPREPHVIQQITTTISSLNVKLNYIYFQNIGKLEGVSF